MYPQVNFPKKATEKWLNRAFAPLSDYLDRTYPQEARKIIAYMMFMENAEQRFYYKNCMTRRYIVFDQAGQLVSCDEDALRYEFEQPNPVIVERLPRERRFIHPNVTRWMEERLSRKEEQKYGEEVCIFLQEYWGPMVNFDFADLRVGDPERGVQAPHVLYLYHDRSPKRIVIQFAGEEIMRRSCSYADYRKYELEERNLKLKGWHVIPVIPELLNEMPGPYRRYLANVVEHALPAAVDH